PFDLLGRRVLKKPIAALKRFVAAPQGQTAGIALQVRGPFSFPRFEPERGLHLFRREKKSHYCLVHTSEVPVTDYRPPDGIEKRGSINQRERRREYDCDKGEIDDKRIEGKLNFDGFRIDDAVRYAIEERLMRDARALMES